MYLTRLQLNPRHRGVRQCLADAQDMHRTIMRAFPQAPETAAGPREHYGVLHRLDTYPRRDELVLLVQSLAEPDWSRLEPGHFSASPCCKRIDESLFGIRDGQVLAFRLRANPTKRVHREPNDPECRWTGKRVALTVERDAITGDVVKNADEVRLAWLGRKGEHGGFELADVRGHPGVKDVRIHPEPRVFASRRRKTFWPVLFEGHLHITDVDQFRKTLATGIGPAKAYGFGLLSIAPPQRH